MPSIAIVIPCYNEQNRLNKTEFVQFANSHSDIHFIFVNDGSSDKTRDVIEEIKSAAKNLELLQLNKNHGKGEAVRQGILHALKNDDFGYIGYLDADLSTSLDEFYYLCKYCIQNNADFIFGSRIKKLGADIKRSFLRHISARMIVTFIDKKFGLGYYDTQCGAKLFKSFILKDIVNQPFSSKWFFDIEIFLRLKATGKNYSGIEYPLKKWHTVDGSKLNIFSFPAICREIFVLFSKYK